MTSLRASLVLVVSLLAACGKAPAAAAEPDLATYIDTLRAIDAHAHPLTYVAEGEKPDSEYDALPLDGLPPFDVPASLTPANPAFREAQQALYSLTSTDTGEAWATAVARRREDLLQREEDRFPRWILDHLRIETMLANRVAMGTGLEAPRFRWISFADPLLLPLDTRTEAARTPDTRPLYALEARLRDRYLRELGLAKLPATLAEYEDTVIEALLEKQREAGAVGVKFEAAYLRALDFAPADTARAASIYKRYASGGVPSRADYKLLQDHLMRVICRGAGALGMAVQLHSTNGFGGSYDAAGAAPHHLESLVSDTTLRDTRFIVVHGGWPLVDETEALMARPNVYADLSMMVLLADRAALAAALRKWLTSHPSQVLFGTDAFHGGPQQAWEQVGWVANRNARQALGDALAGMVADRQVTPVRAREIARMVLRDNAVTAFRLDEPATTAATTSH